MGQQETISRPYPELLLAALGVTPSCPRGNNPCMGVAN